MYCSVAKHESINEMSQKNLAIVFGPTLMSSIDHTDQASTVNLSSMKLEEEISCIKELLNNFEEIFEVKNKLLIYFIMLYKFKGNNYSSTIVLY